MNKILFRVLGISLLIAGLILTVWSLINYFTYLYLIQVDMSYEPTAFSILYKLLPTVIGIIMTLIGFYMTLFSAVGSMTNLIMKSAVNSSKLMTPVIEKQSEAVARGFKKGLKSKV